MNLQSIGSHARPSQVNTYIILTLVDKDVFSLFLYIYAFFSN
jgi:hypothetical protein